MSRSLKYPSNAKTRMQKLECKNSNVKKSLCQTLECYQNSNFLRLR